MIDLKKYGLMITDADKAQAAYKGLMNAGAQLMAGSAPSTRPGGMMRGLAAGGQAFTNTYDDQIAKQRALGMQEYQLGRQFKQDQRADAEHDYNENQRAQQAQAIRAIQSGYGSASGMHPSVERDMGSVPAGLAMQKYQADQQRSLAVEQAAAKEKQRLAQLMEGRRYKEGLTDEKIKRDKIEQERKEALAKKVRMEPLSEARQNQKLALAREAAKHKPLTQDQSKSGKFALRMAEDSDTLQTIVAGPDGIKGTADDYDPTNAKDSAAAKMPAALGNVAMSDEGRQYRAAQSDWIRANLRQESGAVIGAQEMADEIVNYFPQYGDDPKTIRDKAKRRSLAEIGMEVSSGRAFKEMSEVKAARAAELAKRDEPLPLPPGVTEENVIYTMKLRSLTRNQVISQLLLLGDD